MAYGKNFASFYAKSLRQHGTDTNSTFFMNFSITPRWCQDANNSGFRRGVNEQVRTSEDKCVNGPSGTGEDINANM